MNYALNLAKYISSKRHYLKYVKIKYGYIRLDNKPFPENMCLVSYIPMKNICSCPS